MKRVLLIVIFVVGVVASCPADNDIALNFGYGPVVGGPPGETYLQQQPFTIVSTRVVLFAPSVERISGWECAIGIQGNIWFSDLTINGGGTNLRGYPEFVVTYPQPLPATDGMVLMTLRWAPLDASPVCIAVTGLQDASSPCPVPLLYLDGGMRLQTVTWPWSGSNVLAQVNGAYGACAGVMAAESSTWGAVKSLYR
jgi:hypothetical protein